MFDRRHPVVRRVTIGIVASIAVFIVISGAIWWRLASGPISLDVATPWLTAAVEQNFGSRYRIQVGGTQLERDDNGRTALRLRDIVVRDADGAVGGSALTKVEVGVAGSSLLMGDSCAASFRLVDANLVVLIEEDGRANIFAGGERPLLYDVAGGLRPAANLAVLFRLSLQAVVAQRSRGGERRGRAGLDRRPRRVGTRRQVGRCDRVRRQGPHRDRHQQRQPHEGIAVMAWSGASSSSP